MLTIYDHDDFSPADTNKPQTPFPNRKIRVPIRYERGNLFNKTAWEKVVKLDGEPEENGKTWVHNHYVPHTRIIKALDKLLDDKTRREAHKLLTDVVSGLEIQPDPIIKGLNPLSCRVQFDAWAEWAISSIVDWHGIMFYGPGTKDGNGTKLDVPIGPKNGKIQLARVQKSAEKLRQLLKEKLSLREYVPLNEKLYKVEKGESSVSEEDETYWFTPEYRAQWRDILNGNLPKDDEADSDYDPNEDPMSDDE